MLPEKKWLKFILKIFFARKYPNIKFLLDMARYSELDEGWSTEKAVVIAKGIADFFSKICRPIIEFDRMRNVNWFFLSDRNVQFNEFVKKN